jgi:Cell wall-active antibiotics response LiaF, C-terminal
MSTAYVARTNDELAELIRDLPAGDATSSRRRPTGIVFSLFGSSEREGRIRIRRRVTCLTLFGNVDLDLRQATLERDVVTVVALGMFGAIDVYVPEGVEVDLHGFALGGHKRARGNDPPPHPGTPLVRVFAVSIFAGIDDWRVPIAWTQKPWREVIRGIRSGTHKELEA